MESLKEKISKLEKQLKVMKIGYNQVMEVLKKESKEYGAFGEENTANRLMSFYFGQTKKSYDWDFRFDGKFRVDKAQRWKNDGALSGKFINMGWCRVYKEGNPVGFICEKSMIIDVFDDKELAEIWIWYCKEKGYRHSFEKYIHDLKKSNGTRFLEIYEDYLSDKTFEERYNYILKVINEPSIKLKNMVICITKFK